jgi:hypothetical protein
LESATKELWADRLAERKTAALVSGRVWSRVGGDVCCYVSGSIPGRVHVRARFSRQQQIEIVGHIQAHVQHAAQFTRALRAARMDGCDEVITGA